MPTLKTERLLLRDFRLSDWNALNTLLTDPSVTRFMHFASWDETKRRAWLTWMVEDTRNPQRDAYNWAITLRNDDLLIGWFGIGGSSLPTEQGSRSCGYALHPHYWGQGYMPEAMRAIFAYEFRELGTRRIIATCDTQNTASAQVMRKCGMNYEGTFHEADFEGNWATRHHYGIANPSIDVV